MALDDFAFGDTAPAAVAKSDGSVAALAADTAAPTIELARTPAVASLATETEAVTYASSPPAMSYRSVSILQPHPEEAAPAAVSKDGCTAQDRSHPSIRIASRCPQDEGGDCSSAAQATNSITIYVCVTCRGGRPLDLVPVPGEVLAQATAQAAAGTGIAVRPIRCLANCNRGLSAAVRRDGAWTYVFGGLDAAAGPGALVEGAKLFADAPDGLMPWRGRPEALKRGLVARTPPFEVTGDP